MRDIRTMVAMRWIALPAAAAALAACTAAPVTEMPAATAPAAKPQSEAAAKPPGPLNADGTPLTRAEANAQCWMRYDRTAGTLEAKAKLVEKCADEKMAGVDASDRRKPAR
jgi:hypothetical protein